MCRICEPNYELKDVFVGYSRCNKPKYEKQQFPVYNELDTCYTTISIIDKQLRISYSAYSSDSSFTENIDIKFCPFCGKKL